MNLNDDLMKDDIEKLLNDQEGLEESITKRQWQILEAAMKVFSEKGFQGSRTSEIAKEAEVAEGTIFRYYKTKKDLLIGLLIPLIIKFFKPLAIKSAETIIENKKNKPIDELMEDLLLDRLNLIHSNFPLIKTIFMEAAYQPELLKTIQKNLGPKVIPFINNFMEQNIKNENFKDIEPTLMTRTMMSLLLGYIVLGNVFPDYFSSENDEEEIKQIVDIFLHGVAK
ncbi:transcriptional regulator [Clostridium carboxidivorans P7]|uniref:Transcriptional regulator, TetR family n=1 Tax=Clostridium carboxidivorans P7 TaxID=536227 RepID=C6PYG1_9CLOT|nr:TetR/AcrR family transcriptional regulator [Clostridium carboxidivorans]AKN32661.1 transcriptional regulator [Clostridium carboxidivorans P7]EET85726.1 transcriptional regulator, TetR family [Clostridium carboxidivorans P7]EFG90107.1 transcriptional regulator, TetR family [Clostridium carboxidivorans P7]